MSFKVEVMPAAEQAIDDYIRYIAVIRREPLNAKKVLQKIELALSRIELFPHGAPLAPENDHRDYTIRMIVVASCRILFTVDDASKTVRVIAFRHGRRLPDATDLP